MRNLPDPEWWRTFFGPGYLALYDGYLAERTEAEVDQLEQLLQLRPPARILDLPCGQGRHAIELARRGYDVTGMDLSAYLLDVARARASRAGVAVRWLTGDMRQPIRGETFDVITNLYTSFGYFADDADDRAVLDAAAHMLEQGGRFVLEVVNGDRTVARFQEREWFTVGEAAVVESRLLDRGARRMVVERTVSTPTDRETSVHAIRLYSGHELSTLLRAAGFAPVVCYGDWSGEPLTADSRRVVVIATKEERAEAPLPPVDSLSS
jgi:SAM-dependent methyltransferase